MSHHEQALFIYERIPLITYKRHWNISTGVSLKHVIMFLLVAVIFLEQPMEQYLKVTPCHKIVTS